jgi:hypothetical protein
LGSPSLDWQWWLDRGCCRRATATCWWWRGRGHSNSGEDRGGAGPRVARAASRGSRGWVEVVGLLGGRAGSRARRRLSGGGRRGTGSGEPTAQIGQQASAGATGSPSGVRSSACLRRKTGGVKFTGRHPWRTAAARRPREEGLAGFIAVRKAVAGGFLAHQGDQVGVWVVAWPKYGAKGRRRRAACTPTRGWLGGAARVRQHCGPWV